MINSTRDSESRVSRLFMPQSVAVVGASPRGGFGAYVLDGMTNIGYTGTLSVIHPKEREVKGFRAYPGLASLDHVPEAIAVALGAASTPGVLREAADLGVGGAVVFASGFGETGGAGASLQDSLTEAAGGMPVIGPNCLGLVSFRGRAALWANPMDFSKMGPDGTVALAAQSGNMSMTTMMSRRIPSLAYSVSLGNQAVFDVNDCIEYYLTDENVRVIALVIEGIPDFHRFRELATRAADREVAIVALKVGRSPKGGAATAAHTGTLSGSDGIFEALFRQSGVIRVADLENLIATCSVLGGPVRPGGSSLGLFASSGGECALFADLAHDHGVALPSPDTDTESALNVVIPDFGHVGNPFDLTAGGWGSEDNYNSVASAFARQDAIDVVAFVGDAPAFTPPVDEVGWPEMIRGVGEAATSRVPTALITTTTDTHPRLTQLCAEYGVVHLAGASQAMSALAAAGAWQESVRKIRKRPPLNECIRPNGDGPVGAELLAGRSGTLSESLAKTLFARYGIAVPDGETVTDADSATALAKKLKYPVVCKLEAEGVAHKSDIGGVVVGIQDDASLTRAVDEVLVRGARAVGRAAVTGVRIESAADLSGKIEMIVGGYNDSNGSAVVIGAGGVLAELLKDAVTLLWPFTREEALEAVRTLRVYHLLSGYRDAEAVDMDALIDTAIATGRILSESPSLKELDINPLLCGKHGAVALDGLVSVE